MPIRHRLGVSLLAVAASLGAFSQAHAQPYGYAPLPPPRFEAPPPPPPPGPRMVWQRGGWEWDGRGYGWRPGHYVGWHPHYREWIPGHWSRRGYENVWIPAHWR